MQTNFELWWWTRWSSGLGATEETHSHPQKTHIHGYRRKKTPSQLRREERRRNERAEITVLRKVTDTDEAEKAIEAVDESSWTVEETTEEAVDDQEEIYDKSKNDEDKAVKV